jgi:hypothetical protein
MHETHPVGTIWAHGPRWLVRFEPKDFRPRYLDACDWIWPNEDAA